MNDRTYVKQEASKDVGKEKLKSTVMALALQLELQEGRRFNVNKGVEEIVKVLNFSLKSDNEDVLIALADVKALLTDQQIAFFKNKGVDLNGGGVKSANTSAVKTEEDEHKGKKKLVYRGKVTWV